MISIFVSSTFGDMQAERDVLRQRVLPKLNKLVSRYGESVRMIDLRWGVNTTSLSEEQATRKILDVCFDQIDKCDGRMICLLGNRYGWVPNYDIDEMSSRYGLNLNTNVSATELEIQYGILQRNNPHNTMIFMRDEIKSLPAELIDNFRDDNPRLNALKEDLLKNKNCTCCRYSLEYENGEFQGLDDFAEMVYEHLYEYIKAQLDLSPVAHHIRIKKQFDAKIDDESLDYYLLPQLALSANEFITSHNTFAVLKADAGMGKTAFSAYMCKMWAHSHTMFYFFCGNDADTETPIQMLKYFICQVSDYLKVNVECNSSSIQENIQIFIYLLNQFSEDVVFLVDGIDHFVCSYEERLVWLPMSVPDRVKFIFTTSSQDKSYEKINEYSNVVLFTIPNLLAPEKFVKHLLAVNGKDIPDEILSVAFRKHHIDNYYHAKMIAEALVMMDQYDFQGIKNNGDDINAINDFLRDALLQLPKSTEGVALFLLHDYGKRIAPSLIPEVYIYIACNEGGLRASDLESLFGSKWDELSFERYISFLSGIIIERENGCYDFSSSIIRNAVENLIKWKFKKKVMNHIESLPDDDPLKIRCCLNRSLFYEHYDIVSKLIECNRDSTVLAEQFVGCLNYMENEISELLKKYDLHKWFFDNVVSKTTSVQEQEASARIVLNILSSIPKELKTHALEFIGDYYNGKAEYTKAEQCYKDALEEVSAHDSATRGRFYYKLATVLCVNTEEDYEALLITLKQSIAFFQRESLSMDITNRMYCVVAKYQLNIIELNHSLNGVHSIQTFKTKELRLENGVDTPHLSFISKAKIENIKEEVINTLKISVELFNEYRREAEAIYNIAKSFGDIRKILKPFLLTLNGYDILGVSEGRIERVKEIKDDVEKELEKHFDLGLYQTLGMLEYELAQADEDVEEKQQHLLKCCAIWGQFVTQLNLPDFASKYISAEMNLAEIFLDAGDEDATNDHLQKWSQARYYYVINDLRRAFNQCKRYPDEIHLVVLEEVRDDIADVNRVKARMTQLGKHYTRCEDIDVRYFVFLIKSCIFKQLDVFSARENFSFESYWWLKSVYVAESEKLLNCSDGRDIVEYVCIYILRLMERMLDLVPDITANQEKLEKYSLKSYYDEKVYVFEERHKYEMLRLEKICYGFLYAKSLIDQSSVKRELIEQNCLFAIKIFNTLRRILYENEVTPFNLIFPMISQGRINYELCVVETKLAMYYRDVGLLLSSAKTYETVTALALSLMGAEEDSIAGDQIYLKFASISCIQALENYSALGMSSKVLELREKYEAIKMLSLN